MVTNEQVLEVVKAKGPMLPVHIVKEVGGSAMTNTFFIGAMLSELVVSKKLRLSKLKVGGSPLYYAPGQEEKLVNYSKYLHEKEQRAYQRLKDEKVLRDKYLTPVERVALRNIRDFAKPLEVSLKEKELFWKWFLTSNEEAEPIIKNMLKNDDQQLPVQQDGISDVQKTDIRQQSQPEQPTQQNQGQTVQSETEDKRTQQSQNTSDSREKDDGFILQSDSSDSHEKTDTTENNLENKSEERDEPVHEKENLQTEKKETQSHLDDAGSEKQSKEETDDPFVNKVYDFFSQKNIKVMETEIIKKNSEAEFVIKVPSAIGTLNYFCYAKNKKKCNDSDLSMAYVKAQQKNLPALFICPGELSKKGQEALDNDLKRVSFKQI